MIIPPPSASPPEEQVEDLAVPVLEETLDVSKRKVLAGTVKVTTRTEIVEDIAEVSLERTTVDVTHVPINRLVDVAPAVRTEGNTTIVPVLEERIVVLKQLYLKEELHILRRVETEVARTPVQLRRQSAVVERSEPAGPDSTST